MACFGESWVGNSSAMGREYGIVPDRPFTLVEVLLGTASTIAEEERSQFRQASSGPGGEAAGRELGESGKISYSERSR